MNTFNTAKTEKTTNVWLTPRYVLDLLGQFDTDPCAAMVRPWDCARINYTEADNGLLLPWEGRVWLNPPYGNEAEAFMERMSMHQEDHERLLVFLKTLKGKVVLSGYDSELYAAHLDGWRKECKVSHDTQGGKKIECLWMNYNPQLTLF